MARFTLEINHHQRTTEADPEIPLLWVLRDLLHLTGTEYRCRIGLCGAHTVTLMEPERVPATGFVDMSSLRRAFRSHLHASPLEYSGRFHRDVAVEQRS